MQLNNSRPRLRGGHGCARLAMATNGMIMEATAPSPRAWAARPWHMTTARLLANNPATLLMADGSRVDVMLASSGLMSRRQARHFQG